MLSAAGYLGTVRCHSVMPGVHNNLCIHMVSPMPQDPWNLTYDGQ